MGEASDEQKKIRRTYARGVHDTLESFVNPAKMEKLLRSLNTVAGKVFKATSTEEDRDCAGVIAVLKRENIIANPRYDVVLGCLSTLERMGLLKETSKGFFRQVPVTPKVYNPVLSPEALNPAPQAVKPEPIPMATPLPIGTRKDDKFAPLEKLVNVCTTLKGVIKELEEIALDIEQGLEKTRADVSRVRQLQDLLKQIGGD